MRLIPFFLIFSFAFCKADDEFNISIQVGTDGNNEASKSGSFEREISESDSKAFGIGTQGELTATICDFLGGCGQHYDVIHGYLRPSDKDSQWDSRENGSVPYYADVRATLRPVNVKVETKSEPSTLKTAILKNTGDVGATMRTGISAEVEDSWEDNWSDTYGFQFEQKFTYDAKFLGSGGGGETTVGFTGEWAKGGSESTSYTVGSSSEVEVYLEPGQSALVELEARRGTAVVKTTYEVELSGLLNYIQKYIPSGNFPGLYGKFLDIKQLAHQLREGDVKMYVTQEAHFSAYNEEYITLKKYSDDTGFAPPKIEEVFPAEKVPKKRTRSLLRG